MNNITIERVRLTNIDQLQKIGKQTFLETFASSNSKEDMAKYLEESFSIDKLTNELNDRTSEFYFAILGK
nr:GNAT family N-acetyltransferase [Parabacteroides sp.]